MKRLFFAILVTAVLLFVLFRQISLKDFLALLQNIHPLWTALGSAAYFLATLFRALRYKWLIHSKDVSLNELFRISVFYNLSITVLPSKLGELSYPYFLNKISGVSMTEGLASLIASRVYDFFILGMVFLFVSASFQSLFGSKALFVVLLSVLSIGLVLLVFFHMNQLLRLLSKAIEKLSKRTRKEPSKPLQWIQKKLYETAEDFYAIKARKTYLLVAFMTFISWTMVFFTFYAFVRGFGIAMPFLDTVFGSTVAIIASALPVGSLGNWGTLEAGWAVGFLMMGLPKGKAIASGFGVHILIFVVTAIFGLICWVTVSTSRFSFFKGKAEETPSRSTPTSGEVLNHKDTGQAD